MAVGKGTSPSKKRYYEEYKKNHTRDKNKIKKITRYLKSNPNDVKVLERIKELEALIK